MTYRTLHITGIKDLYPQPSEAWGDSLDDSGTGRDRIPHARPYGYMPIEDRTSAEWRRYAEVLIPSAYASGISILLQNYDATGSVCFDDLVLLRLDASGD